MNHAKEMAEVIIELARQNIKSVTMLQEMARKNREIVERILILEGRVVLLEG